MKRGRPNDFVRTKVTGKGTDGDRVYISAGDFKVFEDFSLCLSRVERRTRFRDGVCPERRNASSSRARRVNERCNVRKVRETGKPIGVARFGRFIPRASSTSSVGRRFQTLYVYTYNKYDWRADGRRKFRRISPSRNPGARTFSNRLRPWVDTTIDARVVGEGEQRRKNVRPFARRRQQ